MTDDALSRLDTEVDKIAQTHDARVNRHRDGGGHWIVSIETEEWACTAEGHSEAQALSNLIKNAKAQGIAS